MFKLLVLVTILSVGCTQLKSDETNVIDCAKTEASVVSKGVSVLQVAGDVAAALAAYEVGGVTAVLAGVEALVAKYGEPIVACAVNAQPSAPITAGSGSASHGELAPTARQATLAHYGWRFAK